MSPGRPTDSRSHKATPVGGVLAGIGLASGSYATFALHDAAIKWLVADYSPWQVLFVRSSVILSICLIIGRLRIVFQTLRSPIRNALFARSLVLLLAWLCFYSAAKSLQLAELMTIDNPQVIHSSLQLALKNLGLARMINPASAKVL